MKVYKPGENHPLYLNTGSLDVLFEGFKYSGKLNEFLSDPKYYFEPWYFGSQVTKVAIDVIKKLDASQPQVIKTRGDRSTLIYWRGEYYALMPNYAHEKYKANKKNNEGDKNASHRK